MIRALQLSEQIKMVNMFIMSLMITCASAVSWPSGRFSIPKPKSGCPSGWSEGWRYQDNEDTNNHNIITLSVSHHFYGTFGRDTTMYYCTKTISSGSGSWPRGNYCIGRYDGVCPSGFCPGFIYWDDEDNGNGNRKSGVLPDGVYNRNTKINYCCRSDGSSYSYITLPTSKPFYLYKYTSTCQRVRGMTVRQESITMDDENERNASSEGGCHPRKSGSTKVDFCYYY